MQKMSFVYFYAIRMLKKFSYIFKKQKEMM